MRRTASSTLLACHACATIAITVVSVQSALGQSEPTVAEIKAYILERHEQVARLKPPLPLLLEWTCERWIEVDPVELERARKKAADTPTAESVAAWTDLELRANGGPITTYCKAWVESQDRWRINFDNSSSTGPGFYDVASNTELSWLLMADRVIVPSAPSQVDNVGVDLAIYRNDVRAALNHIVCGDLGLDPSLRPVFGEPAPVAPDNWKVTAVCAGDIRITYTFQWTNAHVIMQRIEAQQHHESSPSTVILFREPLLNSEVLGCPTFIETYLHDELTERITVQSVSVVPKKTIDAVISLPPGVDQDVVRGSDIKPAEPAIAEKDQAAEPLAFRTYLPVGIGSSIVLVLGVWFLVRRKQVRTGIASQRPAVSSPSVLSLSVLQQEKTRADQAVPFSFRKTVAVS